MIDNCDQSIEPQYYDDTLVNEIIRHWWCVDGSGNYSDTCDQTISIVPSGPVHFSFASNTGGSYSIVVNGVGAECVLDTCDEIGVFDGSICVGAAVYDGTEPFGLTAWRDDNQTGVLDGYVPGHEMSFRVWDHTTGSGRVGGGHLRCR